MALSDSFLPDNVLPDLVLPENKDDRPRARGEVAGLPAPRERAEPAHWTFMTWRYRREFDRCTGADTAAA